jgi:hypothetical protein
MEIRKLSLTAVLAVSAALASSAAAFAMQPASVGEGYSAGAEIGASVSNGTQVAAAGDFTYGIRTNLLRTAYTGLVADVLTTARNVGGVGSVRETLWSVGARQVLPTGGTVPIAVEGGFSNFSLSKGGGSTSGGFVGGRATFGQGGATAPLISAMFRWHFQGGGFYQAGAGVAAPIGKGSGLYYQADYYHLGSTGGLDSDTVLIGVRFTGGKH